MSKKNTCNRVDGGHNTPSAESSRSPGAAERDLIRLAQSGCCAARNQLLLDAQPALRALVAMTFPCSQDQEDLVQECVLELVDVIDRYDLDNPANVRLMTFARKPLLGALARFCRRGASSLDTSLDNLCLPDLDAESVEAQIDAQRLPRVLGPVLAALDARTRDVLIQRIMADDPIPLRALADQYQLSCPRVHAIQRRAVEQVSELVRQRAPDLVPV